MAIEKPLYDVGNVVYFKESAALGFIEAVTISGMMRANNQWIYSIRAKAGLPTAVSQYGDRTSLVHGHTLFFSESELINLCDALALAEDNAQRVLNNIQAQRNSLCPSTE